MDDKERWLADLSCADEEVRRQAVKSLGEARPPGVLDLLIEALGDASWRVRKEASEALLAMDDPSIVYPLLAGLRDEANAGRRNAVVETVIRLGPRAIPPVSRLGEDADPDIRKFGVDILGGIAAPEVVPLLILALEDEDENVAAAAAEYLGQKNDLRAIPPLLHLLEKGSFWLKFCALRSIGQLADEDQEEEVLGFLEDSSLRSEAIEVLSRIGGPKSFSRLLEWYTRGGARERTKIMDALLSIINRVSGGDAERVPPLIAAILRAGLGGEFGFHLRRAIAAGGEEKCMAVRAAGYVPSREMLQELIGALEASDEEDREDILAALILFPEEYLPDLFPYLASESTIIRRKVAGVFGRRRYRPALPLMLPLARDEDGHVRAAVARALGHLGDASAVMPLHLLLKDPYPDVRDAAVSALTEMAAGDAALRTLIRQVISSSLENDREREQVAESSLQALGNMGDPSLVPVFTHFLKDARAKVRRAALASLGRLGTPGALEAVLTTLTDEDPDMRAEAVRIIGQTKDGRYRTAVVALVGDEDGMVAAEALRALGALGGEGALALLEEAARSGTGLKQLAAIRALCASGGGRERDILKGLLPLVNPEGKREIISFLGGSGRPQDMAFILPCLDDADWSVRLATVEAIGRSGDAQALALIRGTCHPREKDPLVRRAMENVLRRRE